MITGQARIAGVMGWPVAHSRSPRLHGYWLQHYGLDGAYIPLPVRPEHLGEALNALPKLGFRGVNLTIPHKQNALDHLQEIEPVARLVGAVNTVTVHADGHLSGRNTDIEGFRAAVAESQVSLATDRPAVVLGAGGAARAVVAALKLLGFRTIRLVNRTAARAQSLIGDLAPLELTLEPWSWTALGEALREAGFLVNTTSLGMSGHDALEIDLSPLPSQAAVADIVYVPLETALLAAARARGLAVIDGLGMLLHQARPGFEAWFGVSPKVTPQLRAYILAGA